jgi:hypothetical protein
MQCGAFQRRKRYIRTCLQAPSSLYSACESAIGEIVRVLSSRQLLQSNVTGYVLAGLAPGDAPMRGQEHYAILRLQGPGSRITGFAILPRWWLQCSGDRATRPPAKPSPTTAEIRPSGSSNPLCIAQNPGAGRGKTAANFRRETQGRSALRLGSPQSDPAVWQSAKSSSLGVPRP